MDALSTLNSGSFTAARGIAQNKVFQLNNLASQARRLTGTQNPAEGYRLDRAGLLNNGQKTAGSSNDNKKELMEVAQKFEAILIHQMLKAMRQTVHKSDLLNSFSMEQYESMLDEEIANDMAAHRGIGLAKTLFYQLSRLDEAANPKDVSVTTHQTEEVISNE
jgi:Rod binding domain-containing protein